ncbi:FtsK/SpoIIIE domain-containing protein [Luteolibacter sp. SL250]|uniref:FtsK/SpoIIIE domain-containing protein n=1 Tax=Luteolibacter sp. SL250 TaxID=2995170 RepID=UPI00227094BE|nr:FtsK/SpoIIIE domain-containing protein [Luteolibacter sp. SL250]WAC19564.1 FtsK/SpoIIIE domain-containing protein [Luteolibacter sp. SL250]
MPNATDPIDPARILSAIEGIKRRVAQTAEAELDLEKTRKSRSLKLAQEITRREESDAAALAARLAELEATYQTATSARERAYMIRRDHLPRAYHASRATLAKRLEEKKLEAVGKAQGTILSERKVLHERLEAATSRHQSVMVDLLTDREAIRLLRDETFKVLRTYGPVMESLFEKKNGVDAQSGDRKESLEQIAAGRAHLEEAGRQPLANAFRLAPLWIVILVAGAVHVAIARGVGPWLFATVCLILLVWCAGLLQAWPAARRIAGSIARARDASKHAEKISADEVTAVAEEIAEHEKAHNEGITHTFQATESEITSLLRKGQQELQKQLALLPDRMLDLHRRRLARLHNAYVEEVANIRKEAEETSGRRKQARANAAQTAALAMENSISQLAVPWQDEVVGILDQLNGLDEESAAAFPAWTEQSTSTWAPVTVAPAAIRIGSIHLESSGFSGGIPNHPAFPLPESSAPLALGFPDRGSILIESDGDSPAATTALNAISIRILASLPPGRASFVFIDPIGLGKDFAGLMHLADYEESLITHRIWTQQAQIEERLAETNEHIEKVIQMYLRNEFATIADYNAQAGVIAEKYRFLVIAGFPSAFSDTAMKRLRSIASSGARCGVHLLIQRDVRQTGLDPALDEELHGACLTLSSGKGGLLLAGNRVTFDPPPGEQFASTLIHRIGKANVDSNRVEVPFSQIMPSEEEVWSLDTSEELRVPIGRTGAKKLQMFSLGKGTRQHALIAGKTGSGKSTLFHVIITNLSLWSSPEQVEFYLVDFKKGVEFKCYADRKLPHARVIAIESDRQFALSVLQRVDDELKRRGELFRKASSQDLASYNRNGGTRLPRTLLLIDEFQEFFTEDDPVAQQASLLLDRIVRQGRAFGIHVILGSQTLGGAYTLARATLGQMAVRIALQCNETDAHLIMDEDNPAPRMLTRPGEGIYNDQSGAATANSPFQIVWLPENERDAILTRVKAMAENTGDAPAPIIFEGNAPAEIAANPDLAEALRMAPATRPGAAHAWLGAPNSIKGPTAATFRRQSGSNLLVVSQSSEQSTSLLAGALVSLAAQYPKDQAEFIILDPRAADESTGSALKDLAEKLPHSTRIGGPADVADWFSGLAGELAARSPDSGRNAPEIFVLIHDIHRFKALRPDDEFRFSYDDTAPAASPSQTLADLVGEGGPSGFHVLATSDTWNNVSRWIPRKLLADFEMRVLFQMSAADSSNLIDSPDASNLGLHKALLHNEQLATQEVFRPYAPLDSGWTDEAAAQITGRQ